MQMTDATFYDRDEYYLSHCYNTQQHVSKYAFRTKFVIPEPDQQYNIDL